MIRVCTESMERERVRDFVRVVAKRAACSCLDATECLQPMPKTSQLTSLMICSRLRWQTTVQGSVSVRIGAGSTSFSAIQAILLSFSTTCTLLSFSMAGAATWEGGCETHRNVSFYYLLMTFSQAGMYYLTTVFCFPLLRDVLCCLTASLPERVLAYRSWPSLAPGSSFSSLLTLAYDVALLSLLLNNACCFLA